METDELATVRGRLRDLRAPLAEAATEAWFDERPDYDVRYGVRGRQRCTDDGVRHIDYLSAAMRVARPEIFIEYVNWARVLLDSLHIPGDDLVSHLGHLERLITERLPEAAATVDAILPPALATMQAPFQAPRSFLEDTAHPELASAFVEALIAGARREASVALQEAVEGGLAIEDLYLEVFQPSLREVGRLWQIGELSVAQEHLATATTQLIMAQLYPKIFNLPAADRGTLVATCVEGNLHEVGVRMLADIFSLRGWQTHLLGANTPTSSVVSMVSERRADVVAISATLVEQIDAVADLVSALRASTSAKILVGGPPFLLTPSLADAVQADGMANDARSAVALAESITRQAT